MDNKIELDPLYKIAEVPIYEYDDKLTIQEILVQNVDLDSNEPIESRKEKRKDRFRDFLTMPYFLKIGGYFLITLTLLFTLIFDIANVFLGDTPYSRLLELSLDTSFELFYYLTGFLSILAIALFYFMIAVNDLVTSNRIISIAGKKIYRTFDNEILLARLQNEGKLLKELVEDYWTLRFNDDKLEENDPRVQKQQYNVVRSYFLKYSRDYWDTRYIFRMKIKDQLFVYATPFLLVFSTLFTILLIVEYNEEKIIGGILILIIAPLLAVVLDYKDELTVKPKNKFTARLVSILLNFLSTIVMIAVGGLLVILVFSALRTIDIDTQIPFLIGLYLYAVSLYYTITFTSIFVRSFNHRRKLIKRIRGHYMIKIDSIEKELFSNSQDTISQAQIFATYERLNKIRKQSALPAQFRYFLLLISTIIGLIGGVSGLVASFFDIIFPT